jgi:hypothetical protein
VDRVTLAPRAFPPPSLVQRRGVFHFGAGDGRLSLLPPEGSGGGLRFVRHLAIGLRVLTIEIVTRDEAFKLHDEIGNYINGDLRPAKGFNDDELEAELSRAGLLLQADVILSNGSTSSSVLHQIDRYRMRVAELEAETAKRRDVAARELATENYHVDKKSLDVSERALDVGVKTHGVTVSTLWIAVAALVVALITLGVAGASLWLQYKQATPPTPPTAPLTLGLTPTTSDAGQ